MFNGCPCSQPSVLGSSLRVRFALRSMSLCFGLWHKKWSLLSTVRLLHHPRGDFHKTSLSTCWDTNASYTMCVLFRNFNNSLHFGMICLTHTPFPRVEVSQKHQKTTNQRWMVESHVFPIQHEDGWPADPLCPVLDPNPTISTLF